MQRIHGDHAVGQPEFAEQALDGRDLVGLVVDLEKWPSTSCAIGGKALTKWAGRVSVNLSKLPRNALLPSKATCAHALARGALKDLRVQTERPSRRRPPQDPEGSRAP